MSITLIYDILIQFFLQIRNKHIDNRGYNRETKETSFLSYNISYNRAYNRATKGIIRD